MPELVGAPVADQQAEQEADRRADPADRPERRAARSFQRTMAVGIALLAVVLAAVAWISSAEPVRLGRASPAAGGTVELAPTEVSLDFDGPVRSSSVMLAVNAPDGASVTTGSPVLDGGRLSVPVAVSGPGTYLVTYRLGLDRGRVVSGTTEFTVGSGTGSRSADPDEDDSQESAAGGHSHGHDMEGPFNIGLLVVDAVLLAVVVPLVVRRPRAR
ncbi:copper resistance CopC family protein [Kitasatospora sp. NPDC088351]|uniref:copper resistance CopC family protein n=1 Tax=unclassified Kitasatospora TaxID=2633591 RepID=UPI003449521D